MVKSNRRRRQGRAKRSSSASARNRTQQRRRLAAAVGRVEQSVALLDDPATPVEVVAATIRELYSHRPVPPGLARRLAEDRRSTDDVVAVAAALDELDRKDAGDPSLAALTFGALAVHLAGDHARARVLLDRVFETVDDPEMRLWLVGHLIEVGRVADALDLLGTSVADADYDDYAAQMHQFALEEAQRRATGTGLEGECPCGSGRAWTDCCRPREAAALASFADRSGMYALRTAVTDYLKRSPYGPSFEYHVRSWLESADAAAWEPAEAEALSRLAQEHAWLLGSAADDDEDEYFDLANEPARALDNVLTELADDPATPATIAAAARTWRDNIRYGLWLVADPVPAPGLLCIDIVTGREVYVSVAPEQAEGLARWSVLVGAIVPLDGAWRVTGTFVRASPAEGDIMCEAAWQAAEIVMQELGRRAGVKIPSRLRHPPARGATPPHNVYAYMDEPADPAVADLAGKVVGSLLPRLLGELRESRATPPVLTNTDGEAITMIKARIRVHDGAALATALADHPDFSSDPDEPGEWTWLGETIPNQQRQAMLAQARAQLRAQGHADADIEDTDDEPGRWVRGKITAEGDELSVQVNSRERLDALVKVLTGVGARPTIVDQSRVDPRQDLPWPSGYRPVGGGAQAPAGEGWERAWLDEHIPALRGRTPRAAARSEDWPLVEGLLRQFEYDADIAGGTGADIAWLREQLDLRLDRFF